MGTVAVGVGGVGAEGIWAQGGSVPVVPHDAGWLDLAGAVAKGLALLLGAGGAAKWIVGFWDRDRSEGAQSRAALLEDRAAQVQFLRTRLEDVETERDVLREQILEERTKNARLEAQIEVRTTDHGIG